MGFEESNIGRRQNIADLVRTYSGTASDAANRALQEREGKKNRRLGYVQTALDTAKPFVEGFIEKQKYKEGSPYSEFTKAQIGWEAQAEVDIREAQDRIDAAARAPGGYMSEYEERMARMATDLQKELVTLEADFSKRDIKLEQSFERENIDQEHENRIEELAETYRLEKTMAIAAHGRALEILKEEYSLRGALDEKAHSNAVSLLVKEFGLREDAATALAKTAAEAARKQFWYTTQATERRIDQESEAAMAELSERFTLDRKLATDAHNRAFSILQEEFRLRGVESVEADARAVSRLVKEYGLREVEAEALVKSARAAAKRAHKNSLIEATHQTTEDIRQYTETEKSSEQLGEDTFRTQLGSLNAQISFYKLLEANPELQKYYFGESGEGDEDEEGGFNAGRMVMALWEDFKPFAESNSIDLTTMDDAGIREAFDGYLHLSLDDAVPADLEEDQRDAVWGQIDNLMDLFFEAGPDQIVTDPGTRSGFFDRVSMVWNIFKPKLIPGAEGSAVGTIGRYAAGLTAVKEPDQFFAQRDETTQPDTTTTLPRTGTLPGATEQEQLPVTDEVDGMIQEALSLIEPGMKSFAERELNKAKENIVDPEELLNAIDQIIAKYGGARG